MRALAALVASIAIVFTGTAVAETPLRSVPPAQSLTPVDKSQSAIALHAVQVPLVISLGEPMLKESSLPRTTSTAGGTVSPTRIGFGRDVPDALRSIGLASLKWQATTDGGRVAQIVIASPGAAGLRVALQMKSAPSGVTVRLKGDGSQSKVLGPFAAGEIVGATRTFGEWWSPVMEGGSATIEIVASAADDLGKTTLVVARVSHLLAVGPMRPSRSTAGTKRIGDSGTCEVNLKCEPQTPALTNAANAVAEMMFTQVDGSTYTCTGTLLNDSQNSGIPYFFTADHCIDSAYAAQTLNLFWFYDSIDCDDPLTPGNFQRQNGGSAMLGRSQEQDWVLLRLNGPPPAGTIHSGWNAAPISSGQVIDVSHPKGDLSKFAAGAISGYQYVRIHDEDGVTLALTHMASVTWSQGMTEPGSSGSGLLTLRADPGGDYYELRGGLSGAPSSTCDDTTIPQWFTRLDQMLPKMRDYLLPGTNAANESIVVEFYNQTLDHYFMTASPAEIAALDNGTFVGWQRTGLRFLAYTAPVAGASPVCRFYRAPGFGDSHFYSASPSECSALVDNPKFPGWLLESSNVFYIVQPDTATGACPAATHPLWRFFHVPATNHRYTDDVVIRDRLRAESPDWLPEGYGPDAVIMCAPNGI